MAKAIMRCAKLASLGSVASSLKHNFRERETPNADQEREGQNAHLGAKTTTEAMGKLRELLPEKRRKDAVVAIEYVCTASPEWWKKATPEQQETFFQRSVDWLADKYGRDRIITATIHRDETSPHLAAYVVPLTKDGRLSAKEYIGNRTQMSDDQTSYAARVADLGIERGIKGSRAKHQTLKEFYAKVNEPVREIQIRAEEAAPRVLEKGLLSSRHETPEMVAKRLSGAVNASVAHLAERAKLAESSERRTKELEATLADQNKRLNPIIEALRPLNDQERQTLVQLVKAGSERIQEQRKERIREQFKAKAERDRSEDRGRSR